MVLCNVVRCPFQMSGVSCLFLAIILNFLFEVLGRETFGGVIMLFHRLTRLGCRIAKELPKGISFILFFVSCSCRFGFVLLVLVVEAEAHVLSLCNLTPLFLFWEQRGISQHVEAGFYRGLMAIICNLRLVSMRLCS